MCRQREPLKYYHNNELMLELNDMMIRLKIHLIDDCESYREKYTKPTPQELDRLQSKINEILRKDYTYMAR